MAKAKDVYSLVVWTWDKMYHEYEPIIHNQRSLEVARSEFEAMKVTGDTPQIDLVLRHVNRYGCEESQELLERKD